MQSINYNSILNREAISLSIKNILMQFEQNKYNFTFKRGIYIYGAPGSGKTQFVINLLNEPTLHVFPESLLIHRVLVVPGLSRKLSVSVKVIYIYFIVGSEVSVVQYCILRIVFCVQLTP